MLLEITKTCNSGLQILFFSAIMLLSGCSKKEETIFEMPQNVASKFQKLDSLVLYQINYHQRFQPELLEKYNSSLSELYKSCPHPQIKTLQYLTKGFLYSKSHFSDSVLENYQKAITLAKEHKFLKYEALILTKLGDIYNYSGDIDLAFSSVEKSIDLWAELKNYSKQAHSYNFLGLLYSQNGDYEKAFKQHRTALSLFKKLDDTEGILVTLDCLGQTAEKNNLLDEAITYHQRALEISQDIDSNEEEVKMIPIQKLAHLNFLKGNYHISKGYYQRIMGLNTDTNSTFMGVNYLGMANVSYAIDSNYLEAMEYFNKALDIAERVKVFPEIARIKNQMATFQSQNGEFEAAFKNYKHAMLLEDSIYGAKTKANIIRTNSKFNQGQVTNQLNSTREDLEYEKNYTLIISIGTFTALTVALIFFIGFKRIKKNNKTLSEQKNQITKALEERELLLKEVHHRVKNNLQIISSLLYLQSDDNNNPEVKKILEDGHGRIASMALIHQKLYESENLKNIPIGEYISDLVIQIKSSFGKKAKQIDFEVESGEYYLDVDTSVPIGLIVNELVTNSIKHAFNESSNGSVNISLKKSDMNFTLTVSDNGLGFKYNDALNHKSLGLQLISMLCNQLGAGFEFKNDQGTKFIMNFEKPV